MDASINFKICPQCHSRATVKNGSVQGVRKWKCKQCKYQFSKDTLQKGKSNELKRLALHMYLEGLDLRSIGRILKVSNVAVLKWVKKAAVEIQKIHKEQSRKKIVTIMELDEICHYIGKKSGNIGSGLLMIEKEKSLLPLSSVIAIIGREEGSGAK
jgi:transposase-like protein